MIPELDVAILAGNAVHVNGAGRTNRDFCLVDDMVQAVPLAGKVTATTALNQIFNAAVGDQTDPKQLQAPLLAAMQR